MQEKLQTKWDLEHYYYSSINDSQIEIDFEKYVEHITSLIEKYKGNLRNFTTFDEWNQWFEDSDENEFISKANGIFMYFSYVTSLDTQNQEAMKIEAKYSNKARELGEELLFIDEEFKAIGYDTLIELSQKEELKDFSKVFYDKAQNLKYELDTQTEKAFLIKSRANVSGCNVALYDELKNSFMFEMKDENGEVKSLTEEELSAYAYNENRELRERASKVGRKKYVNKQNQIVFGNIYSSIVKDSVSSIKLRGYDTVMSPRNLGEDLEDSTVDLLLEESEKRIYPLYQKYLELKKKILGVDVLRPWDLYAPIGKTEKTFEFEQGAKLFLDEIKKVDEDMYKYSVEMFERGRTDVFPNEGKRGGAYCNFLKNQPSFVLLNYNKSLNDVSTIAHEFGHAYHGHLLQEQPSRYYWCGLSLAETASVFNELLLSHKLLEQIETENIQEKIYVLAEELNGFFATIARQIMYTVFEKKVHETFLAGEDLTYEDFNTMFRAEQEKLYGGVVEFDTEPEEDATWSRIPHIHHLPFYCYSYAFGQTLSISLYEQYLEEGDSFIPKYKEILKAGSSQTPKEILLNVGIDIDSVEFYARCENFIAKKLDEFEALVNEQSTRTNE